MNKMNFDDLYNTVNETFEGLLDISWDNASVEEYFRIQFKLLVDVLSQRDKINSFSENGEAVSITEFMNAVYSDILPQNYETSFANPTFAVKCFGTELGRLLSAIAAEIRGAIYALYDVRECVDEESIYEKANLLMDLYSLFVESGQSKTCSVEAVEELFYEYYEQHLERHVLMRVKEQVLGIDSDKLLFDSSIKLDVDDKECERIYHTGEYITSNEVKMYKYLRSLPKEKLQAMADTFTEGYIKGFEVTGRDLSIKETCEIRFNIGFLPMIDLARENLKKVGLDVSLVRAGFDIFTGHNPNKNGFFGGNPNPQFDYDHKDDLSLILDDNLVNKRLECLKKAYEELKGPSRKYAGPAVIDIFGEEMFVPEDKPQAVLVSENARKLMVTFASKAGQIVNEYIPGDERSFTIIAFPVPSIGDDFEEIFNDTIRINTLDYTLYRDIQQKIIDSLDKAECVKIKGMGENSTDLTVKLHKLSNPDVETNFENCVADVNIPVGEVFTSPLLSGTNGILNVKKVFLNGLEYKNLTIKITDGMIKEYTCDNYANEDGSVNSKPGKKLIEDNILHHHESLPMGEFAIGTNTTAYMVARKYNIEALMPILIAEKTGPHFAFGDTCYSHCEDLKVYNPDRKEIIARDNECSLMRKTEPEKAYFNCHTDITIPYDELGDLSAVLGNGECIHIIKEGRFVLPGCEALNAPFDEK